MVDFNNDTTVGMPAVDIERVSILQRRYDFIEAFEFYKKRTLSNVAMPNDLVRSRLLSLFLQMQGGFKRRYDKKDYDRIKDACWNSKTEEDIIEAFYQLSEELDKLNITKIDNRRAVRRDIAEEENKDAGL